MKVTIDAEGGGLVDAATFAESHVIVSKRDLGRIKRLAKRLGFYPELKALDIRMQEIVLTGLGRPRPDRASPKRRRRPT